jgi:hypothetical protein
MPVGRPIAPLVLIDEEIKHHQSIAKSRSLPYSLVQKDQIILACGAVTFREGVTPWLPLRRPVPRVAPGSLHALLVAC